MCVRCLGLRGGFFRRHYTVLSLQSERREQHFTPGRFTPIKLPEGPPLEGVAQLLDFPRHRLRLLEKLGEGDFGMVSLLLFFSCRWCVVLKRKRVAAAPTYFRKKEDIDFNIII